MLSLLLIVMNNLIIITYSLTTTVKNIKYVSLLKYESI